MRMRHPPNVRSLAWIGWRLGWLGGWGGGIYRGDLGAVERVLLLGFSGVWWVVLRDIGEVNGRIIRRYCMEGGQGREFITKIAINLMRSSWRLDGKLAARRDLVPWSCSFRGVTRWACAVRAVGEWEQKRTGGLFPTEPCVLCTFGITGN